MSGHSERKHSRFSPSGASRWFACPGSVRLCDEAPERTSLAAEEGTRAHELLESLIRHDGLLRDVLWSEAPQEMRDACQTVYDYVHEILSNWPDAILILEDRVRVPTGIPDEEMTGLSDIGIYIQSLRLLYIIDFKYGAGVWVPVEGNKQTRCYALGTLNEHPDWNVDSIALVIIQPRHYMFNEQIPEDLISIEELRAFGEELTRRISAALQPDAPLIPGEEQCRFCNASRFNCHEPEKQLMKLAGGTFSDIREITSEKLLDPKALTLERIAYILDGADMVRDWFKRIEERALELAVSGTPIPGRKVVEAQARRVWEFEGKTVESIAETLSAMCGNNVSEHEFAPRSLVGIGEAEKLLKNAVKSVIDKADQKIVVEEVMRRMAFLTTKKSSGTLSLVSENDSRPEVNRAADAFAQVVSIGVTGE